MTESPSVEQWAVVIPSFNRTADAVACVHSVWNASPRPERIVLVDDASTDGAVQKIAAWAEGQGIPFQVELEPDAVRVLRPGLTIIAASQNEGFTLASNKGLALVLDGTEAPYVLLLNNDAVVTESFFAELAAVIGRHRDAGMVSGIIYEWDRTTLWYAGGRFNVMRALSTHDTAPPGDDDMPRHTDWISGCTMLISREVLRRLGTLATCFSPCYSEDVDYSLRARAAGFELFVAPRAVAYHRVGLTLGRPGRQRPEVIYVANRNRAFVVRRNYAGLKRLAGLSYLAVTKPLRAAAEVLRGRPRAGWAIIAGTMDGLLNPAAAAPRAMRAL